MAHFTIQSETLQTTSPIGKLFDFMGDFNHFKHLLPEDKIENFSCTSDECSFSIKGITQLTIRIKEKVKDQRITYETSGLAKFIFTLHIHFSETTLPQCQVELEGDINPFIKVMAEKPLSELVNTMAHKLSKLQLD